MHWAFIIAFSLLLSCTSALLLNADLKALQPLMATSAAS